MTEDIQAGIAAVAVLLAWLGTGYAVAMGMDMLLRRATRFRNTLPHLPLHGVRCVCDRCSRDT